MANEKIRLGARQGPRTRIELFLSKLTPHAREVVREETENPDQVITKAQLELKYQVYVAFFEIDHDC
ncbi:MAG: hypothetical protein ABL921_33680 [Pirellula sp.]